jgi:hypothetical protein
MLMVLLNVFCELDHFYCSAWPFPCCNTYPCWVMLLMLFDNWFVNDKVFPEDTFFRIGELYCF